MGSNTLLHIAALMVLTSCSVGPGGSFESLSGSSGGADGQEVGQEVADEESGFPPGAACEFELGANPLGKSPCSDAEDCCAGPLVGESLAGGAGCPSSEYPNNWSCVEGECIPGGCADNGDCKNLMGDSWICATISGVGHCVVFCDDDSDCVAENMPHATCEDIENYSFCVQPQP